MKTLVLLHSRTTVMIEGWIREVMRQETKDAFQWLDSGGRVEGPGPAGNCQWKGHF